MALAKKKAILAKAISCYFQFIPPAKAGGNSTDAGGNSAKAGGLDCIKKYLEQKICCFKTIPPAIRYNPSGPNTGPLGFSLLSGLGRSCSFS
jgi:hypothetical protein